MELAKIIEGFGDTVNLILMDGCPSDNKKRLELLDGVDFEFLSENSIKKVYYLNFLNLLDTLNSKVKIKIN